MRDHVQAECPEDYFRKSITVPLSLLYAKWNENKVYRPTRQNRFGTTVGSINYWKYYSITVNRVSGVASQIADSQFAESQIAESN
jgi:hypothetical protein